MSSTAFTPVGVCLLQRQCACGQYTGGGECAECSKKREEGLLQRASIGAAPISAVPPIVHDVLNSPGQPLDAGTRAFMEPRFGYDFSQVRVHADAKAAESTWAVNALAYTVGRDVVFGTGQYELGTSEGRRLVAHELTHVVQQGMNTSQGELELGRPGDTYEQEADYLSEKVIEGYPPHEVTTLGYSSAKELIQRLPYRRLQRWTYGVGVPPHPDYVVVPAGDIPQIERTMLIVSKIVSDPKEFSTCHKFFKNNCPGGTDNTLTNVFNNASLWKDTDPSPTLLASSVDPNHIAYTNKSFGVGRWAVAASMIHELIHNCGQASHVIGDDAKAACGKLPNI